MINGLENLNVKMLGLGRVEREAQSQESVCETLDTNGNRSVAEVALASLRHRIVIDIDDFVQVLDDHLANFVELVEIIRAIVHVNICRKGERSQVANSDLIRCAILDDLCTQVGAADSTEVLLVALSVTSIFVKHEWIPSLGLSLKDGIPKLLCFNSLATLAFALVLLVESLKLITIDIRKARTFVGAHESPLSVLFNTLHEEIRNP
jgi:hypothetical protein